MIEVVTGKTYGEYLKETIFEPLEWVDTDFYVPEDKLDRLMENYEFKPETGTLEPCTMAASWTFLYAQKETGV